MLMLGRHAYIERLIQLWVPGQLDYKPQINNLTFVDILRSMFSIKQKMYHNRESSFSIPDR
jgi:hypothetical protein